MSENPTIFADAMLDASLLHGVLRVRLGQVAGGSETLVPAGQLVVPLAEMRALVAALDNVLREADARLRAGGAPIAVTDSIGGGAAIARPRPRSYSAAAVAARGRSVSHPPPSAL